LGTGSRDRLAKLATKLVILNMNKGDVGDANESKAFLNKGLDNSASRAHQVQKPESPRAVMINIFYSTRGLWDLQNSLVQTQRFARAQFGQYKP